MDDAVSVRPWRRKIGIWSPKMPPMTRIGTSTPASRSGTASSRKATPSERAPSDDQMPGHRHEPVAVGIGLDDRHHRGRRDRRLDRAIVLGETGEADLDDRRPQ